MIRKHLPGDQPQLLELLRLNTPTYFDAAEEQDFIEYLQQHATNYFVVEEAGRLVGAGGFNLGFDEGATARISWDIIHPDFQGKGIGKALTLYRLEEIRKHPEVSKVVVRTTQLVWPFYQRMGFALEKTEKDFWAKGFDLYQMSMELP